MRINKSKWWLFCISLLIQLALMTLLGCEGYQKRITYYMQYFCRPDTTTSSGHNQSAARSPRENVPVELPYCPTISPLSGGPLHINIPPKLTLIHVGTLNPLVVRGGRYRPPDCEARHRTAIIIPHRNRENHLKILLFHLHPFLQRQQLSYGIYVIHQAGTTTFNRAKLMNVGFREAMREEDWDCLFFHDVDLLPEDDRNIYICDSNPKHASVAMDKFGYRLPYGMYFGGVIALTPLQYLRINGFPNNYWGWGGEDDDISYRVLLTGMRVTRPPAKYGRYKMIKHVLDQGNGVNRNRFKMLGEAPHTWRLDGMNTAEYEIISREHLPLYANITVNVGTQDGLSPPAARVAN